MSRQAGSRQFDWVAALRRPLSPFILPALVSVMLSACSYHPPAPIEEQSTAIVKRQLTSDGIYYVRKGDTLYGIAFSYGLDTKDVALWNGISSPYTIYPGQELRLAAPSSYSQRSAGSGAVTISTVKKPASTTTRAATTDSSATVSTATQSTNATVDAGAKKAAAKPVEKAVSAKEPVQKTTTPESGRTNPSKSLPPGSWRWPTDGRVRRGFVAGDPARNGLDITGKEGQPIVATAPGEVVYSGNGLIGYGELIIIKHNEKMLSAYAHNKVRLAHEGERVVAGQKIAEMGRNPSDQPNLHFEIRANGKPVNPMSYLPKK